MSSLIEVITDAQKAPSTLTADAVVKTPIPIPVITTAPRALSFVVPEPTSIFSCPPNAFLDASTGVCILKNQGDSTSIQDTPALTMAQAIGVGIVIGAFIVAMIGILLFLFLRKRRGGKKNAIIVVTDGNKDNIELDKPADTSQIEYVEDPSGYYYR